LRFPEFRGAKGWEPTTIGALGRFYYGKSAPKWSLAEDASTPCVRYGELYTKFGPVITETYSRTNIAPETLRFSKGGEILIPRVGEKPEDFGKCCAYLPLKDIAIGEMISVLETKQHPLFYTYYFRNLYKQFAKVVEGQNVKNLYFTELEPLPIHRPSIPEQQKIADCLSSVDELIAAQAQKVDALKTHKKGLMQQLFPREGETQPRLRLPEFHNAGEWKMTTIGDLKPFITSGSRGWAPFYAEQGELFIRITNLWRDSIYLDLKDSKFVQLPPGSNEGVRTQLKEHDVLISITADIGIIGYVDESVPSPAYINQHIALVRFDTEQLCGKYVAYFLASDKSQRLFRASTDTGTKAGMSLIGIQKIKLMLPGLPEQQRIASCLSSLDALITAETQQLEALKTHKKGLMQQLFPSTDEVAA
ncbi:restriction endonuclease subunit S, partial [Chromobacterium haemolyticum]|uniref:restriction endonuclease subunit S n=1 Tax=Chromobacterium haemolyticum TaxID=394935 RepID=UPI0009FD0767